MSQAAKLQALLVAADQRFRELRREARERGPELAKRAWTPQRIQKHVDGATRTGQILSLLFLGPVIVVSLALITAFNMLIGSIVTGGDWTPGTTDATQWTWFVSIITLGLFCLAAWVWFQFVRTAGFGFFSYDD